MDGHRDYRIVLQGCYPNIIEGLSPKNVLEDKWKAVVGNEVALRNIQEKSSTTEKNQWIFQHVLEGGPQTYQAFKEALQNTKHFKLLAEIDQQEMGVPHEEADLWPQILQRALRNSKQAIISSDLDHRGILDVFTEQDFIDGTQIRDISEHQTSTEKNKLIFKEVEKQGIVGYKTFKQALIDKQEDGVYETLSKEERIATTELISTRDILEDYICYRLHSEGLQCDYCYRHKSNHEMPLTKKVRELSTEFENRYVSKIGVQLDPGWTVQQMSEDNYSRVLNEMFSDEVNWGRIIGLVSFCGALSVSCVRYEMSKETVLEWTLSYVEEKLRGSIIDRDGWVALLDFPMDPFDTNAVDEADGNYQSSQLNSAPLPIRTAPSQNGDGPSQVGDQIKQYANKLMLVAGGFMLGVLVAKS